ncbi:hypothetical protein S122051_2788 [Staphylococcus aureus subsp. aureus 122051]|nr:hypothetical protein S122051_2788 [Staphylococcus aureus subsp. aureus 122051]EOR39483.1 hypothetical protein MRGR3_1859 [Staphylococcus aureus subsp. aureus MRGR3]QGQ73585.1 hypothetical protein SAST44_00307 [Staphylococcus aureus]QGQ76990.1 hypothetical protein SAST45_00310 [Staphylococcus aureus]
MDEFMVVPIGKQEIAHCTHNDTWMSEYD